MGKQVRSKMSEQLKETLEERVVTGIYLPGMRLDETELASEFAVSRTPVREALIQLSMHGLIELRPRRGAVVTEISPQRLYEMFEVMAELEAMCVRQAARRFTESDMAAVQSAQAACEAACEQADADDYYHKNACFHMALYAACHNSFLQDQAAALFRRLGAYRRLQLRHPGRLHSSLDEHAGIVAALLARNGELAAERMRQHVTVQGELFADLMASVSRLGKVGAAA